jgi:hypothetical protein
MQHNSVCEAPEAREYEVVQVHASKKKYIRKRENINTSFLSTWFCAIKQTSVPEPAATIPENYSGCP